MYMCVCVCLCVCVCAAVFTSVCTIFTYFSHSPIFFSTVAIKVQSCPLPVNTLAFSKNLSGPFLTKF